MRTDRLIDRAMRLAPCASPTGSFRRSKRLPLRSIAGVMALTVLSGCSGGVLDPRGPIADANAKILLNALEIMLVIVVPTIVAAKPLEVQVVSLDWKWLFIYPEQGVASVNEIVVPVGTPVHFSLTSASVMNMFFVPQLGSMIATMNGMVTQLHLQADHAGSFFGQSAQYSGDGFSDMHFTLRAAPQADFDQWVAAARQAGSALDLQAYVALAQQSQNVTPYTYREVEPTLFRDLVTQQLPPGPGPAGGSSRPVFRPQGTH
jgi:heme/copper-type cytochrome/quinol oxidase subunit 2